MPDLAVGSLGTIGVLFIGATGVAVETVILPDRMRARQSELILEIAGDSMSYLRSGLSVEAASAVCRLVLAHTTASAVAVTDKHTVLGFAGIGSEHHTVGGPIVTQATRDAIANNSMGVLRGRSKIGCTDPKCALRAAIVVPLQIAGEPAGTLKFYFTSSRRLNRTAIALAEGLGRLFSMQLELDRSRSDLAYLAGHDPLTRMHNRRHFEAELGRALSEAGRFGGTGAIVWFDLDHFKDINDCLGHAVGDDLLVSLSQSIRNHTRDYCTLARLGGDEFGMLLPQADQAEAEAAADRMLHLLSERTFSAGGHEVRITASMGVACYPEHGTDCDSLMSRADLAMYEAKATGGNRVVVYTHDDSWHCRMTEHIETAERIVNALREDRFVLYGQPMKRLSDGVVAAYELLLRMIDVDGRIVMPGEIIPTAERLGIIRDIDRWVSRKAIQLLADESAAGRDTQFCINLSGCACSDPELLGIFHEEFAATGVDPSRLTIEITETIAISDIERAQEFVRALKSVGCQFSLDDFGSGSSSFYYLKHLPVDFLKIDGSLVKGLEDASANAHFVSAIVEMCKGLNICTVAEYVESQDLLDAVNDHGVDYAQGYEVGWPKPLEAYVGTPDADTEQLSVRAVPAYSTSD
ncbi:MAG: EAL domain-containing protein [Coriobacteriales bacterium]|nr:EAL domain-containing protein [Coriobacteriales bacterium]